MRSFEDHVHSFVIRVWQEPREIEGAGPEWRGHIEHVQSGERAYFQHLDRMVEFIVTYLSEPAQRSALIGGKRGVLQTIMRRLKARG